MDWARLPRSALPDQVRQKEEEETDPALDPNSPTQRQKLPLYLTQGGGKTITPLREKTCINFLPKTHAEMSHCEYSPVLSQTRGVEAEGNSQRRKFKTFCLVMVEVNSRVLLKGIDGWKKG